MKSVGVVIPHFRAPAALEKCIACLEAQEGVAVRIFVRDNSADNVLYTRAVNEGLRRFCFGGEHDFALALNQDAFLRADALREMVAAMEAAPAAGICTPVSLTADGKVNWCGGADAYPLGKHLVTTPERLPQAPYESHWANGACMLLRTAMVREIGLLDENMRFICSDSDYSFTARSRGWKVLIVPGAFVQHAPAGTGGGAGHALNKVMLQDQLYFAEKWLSGDLYRRLAFEGARLPPSEVEESVALIRRQIRQLTDLGA